VQQPHPQPGLLLLLPAQMHHQQQQPALLPLVLLLLVPSCLQYHLSAPLAALLQAAGQV
jgi:hypothetical protein